MNQKPLNKYQGIVGILMVLLAAACTPSDGVNDQAYQSALDTAVAATVTAQALDLQRTQGAEAAQAPTETLPPSPTNTVVPDSPTPEPTPTATIEVEETAEAETTAEITPLPEFTLSGPSVQVTVDTNCRSGPGKAYTWLGALMVGEEAVVAGKDPSGAYWYIENPDLEEEFCWIWGFYAVTSGNTAPLPIYTPGPTPLPEVVFSVGYREVESCGGDWQVEFEIANTGRYNLESVSTFVQDTDTSAKTGDFTSNYFVRKSGCTVDQNRETLPPGDVGFSVSGNLNNNPTGHLLFASVTVCTEDHLNGLCQTREWYFTP
jgi:hypothetical protein